MKKLISIGLASIISLVLIGTTPSFADKVTLKVPVWFSTALPSLGSTPKWVETELNKLSKGLKGGHALSMKVYEPGKLVPPKEILESVSTGAVNAGYVTPGYLRGHLGDKGGILSAVPFGPDAPEFMAWIYHGNGRALWQGLYDDAGFNVHSIPCGIIAPETSGWFTKEINSPADLAGLRMRFFGLGALVMEKLGVSTSQLPGGEIVPALEKGAIDATEFSMPAIDRRLGINKILKYNYFPGWHQPATLFDLIINGDTWKTMTETQQQIVELTCKAAMTEGLSYGEAIQFDAMKENTAAGTVNKYWSAEMLATFEAAWLEVVAEMSAADSQFKVIWDDLQAFRADYAIWNEWAYLPRPGTVRK
jgi:TRAP-type mannitol/chloroaromatic compound transport system substrate-binding protein